LEKAGIRTTVAEFSRIPQNTIELDAAAGRKVFKLLDVLEDNDDIQSVTANFSIPDEIMEEVVNGLP
jgi:transcriptional/translational regulatory protein YebC/TACO1